MILSDIDIVASLHAAPSRNLSVIQRRSVALMPLLQSEVVRYPASRNVVRPRYTREPSYSLACFWKFLTFPITRKA